MYFSVEVFDVVSVAHGGWSLQLHRFRFLTFYHVPWRCQCQESADSAVCSYGVHFTPNWTGSSFFPDSGP